MSSSPPPPDPIPQGPSPLALPAPPIQPPSVNPRRLPPPCWSHDETIALIDAYCEKWYALRRGNLKATHWQEVADAVGRRCPASSPPKTAVQCRHKMEKLRKRYRTEIQRARSMPLSRFSSSWVHFKRMDSMEKGPSTKSGYNSDSADEDDNDDEDDDDINQDLYQERPNFKDGVANTRSVHNLYRNGINTGASGGDGNSSGFRIRIPTGVSIAQPGPKIYAKIVNPNANHSPNYNTKPNFGGPGGSGVNYGTRVLGGCEETPIAKREREPLAEMVAAIKMLGDGFVRTEEMKMELARELEAMRMDMEVKRTQMILESQQRIVEAFAKAVSEKNKKPKRMRSPEA
ncbi:trihelix transcription factor ASIL2 [Mangifera indica]|uniref:trihelix transcription factor ASIL2 n=1 Tax=Mangifera indica TaxID=29780 RepID=UPI001CFA1DE9|nr:trihelix transcription factor ASIL2 [Mangifera indica]